MKGVCKTVLDQLGKIKLTFLNGNNIFEKLRQNICKGIAKSDNKLFRYKLFKLFPPGNGM